MSMGVVPTVIAKTINKEQWEHLARKASLFEGSMSDNFYYMGTKKHYHYFMYSPALSIRDIYRIHEDEHAIEKPLPLTMDRTFWKNQRGHVWAGGNLNFQNVHIDHKGIAGPLAVQNGPFLLGPEFFQIDDNVLTVTGNALQIGGNVILDFGYESIEVDD